MTTKIIYDYFLTFNREKIRIYLKQFNSWWMSLYLIVLFPLLMHLFESPQTTARYYAVAIPFLWTTVIVQMAPLKLTKIQYLCPMTEHDRKTYLIGMYFLRIAFPTFLHIAFRIPLIAAEWTTLPETCFELIFFICFSLCVNVNPDISAKEKKDSMRYFNIWLAISYSYGILCIIGYFFVAGECSRATSVWVGYAFGTASLLLAVRMLIYLKHSIAASLHYEDDRPHGDTK